MCGLGGRRFLFDVPRDLVVAAIDVDGEEAGRAGRGARFVAVEEWPDDAAVGLGEREGVELVVMKPIETAFGDVASLDGDGAENSVDEHEPVPAAFEGLFADHPDEVESADGDVDSGLFQDLAAGALGGRFADADFELSADGRAEAEVRGFFAAEEEDSALVVAEVAEASDFVRELGGLGEAGHGEGG